LPGHGKNQLLHLQYHESPVLVKSPWEPCRYCNITYVTINSIIPPLILKKKSNYKCRMGTMQQNNCNGYENTW
jgi:hypothetical protein